MSIYNLIRDEFGIETYERENPITDTVGTTPTRIVPYTPGRVSLLIFNIGSNGLYISPFNTVSTSRGIYLGANGGNASLDWRTDFTLVAHEFFGVGDGGATTIYVLELIETAMGE